MLKLYYTLIYYYHYYIVILFYQVIYETIISYIHKSEII